MCRMIRPSCLTMLIFVSFGLALMACSTASGAAVDERGEVPSLEFTTGLADEISKEMTVSVDLTDQGFQPSTIFVPMGRRVRLVVRNRGTTEHHYRVVGLEPRDLLWHAPEEDTAATDVADDSEDHGQHHTDAFVPYPFESQAGIRPLGDEVHTYVESRADVNALIFTPTKRGTFFVECPLHPDIVGKITVF